MLSDFEVIESAFEVAEVAQARSKMVPDRNIAIEYRSAEGKPDRLAAVASELANLPVDVIAIYEKAGVYRVFRRCDCLAARGAGAAAHKDAAHWHYRRRSGTAASHAAKQATTTIPIVMIAIGDPVRAGLVPSLARPGGNITGNTIVGAEMSGKRIQLIKGFFLRSRAWLSFGIRITPLTRPTLKNGKPWMDHRIPGQ